MAALEIPEVVHRGGVMRESQTFYNESLKARRTGNYDYFGSDSYIERENRITNSLTRGITNGIERGDTTSAAAQMERLFDIQRDVRMDMPSVSGEVGSQSNRKSYTITQSVTAEGKPRSMTLSVHDLQGDFTDYVREYKFGGKQYTKVAEAIKNMR